MKKVVYPKNYIRSSEFVDMGTGLVYWYRTRHGVQPGSVPKGLDIIAIVDQDGWSYFATNRVITTDALKKYDIQEKVPKGADAYLSQMSEDKKRYYGVK